MTYGPPPSAYSSNGSYIGVSCCPATYDLGRQYGINKQLKADRIAAFGAIRHAAKIAREFDERGIWDPELWITADAIRRAIRAAIGSDKA